MKIPDSACFNRAPLLCNFNQKAHLKHENCIEINIFFKDTVTKILSYKVSRITMDN